MSEIEDNLHAVIMGLEYELAEATERNGNLCVELASMTLERDALRGVTMFCEETRISHDNALNRMAVMCTELAAVKLERDELAKWKSTEQRAMLSMGKMLIEAGCTCDGLVEGVAWVIETAAQAGKDGTP